MEEADLGRRAYHNPGLFDDGRRHDGLTTQEREELRSLRRENKRIREEREIVSKAAAWFAKEADSNTRKHSSS